VKDDAALYPLTPVEIVACLRALASRMVACGAAMDYFGGFDVNMASRGMELVGAGEIAASWAVELQQAIDERATPAGQEGGS
jgi:hypothetical protein